MHVDEKKDPERVIDGGSEDETVVAIEDGVVVNASGYKDQLKRQYGLLGLAGIALTVDNAWIALGSSISVSIRESFRSKHQTPMFIMSDAMDDSNALKAWRLLTMSFVQSMVDRRALSLALSLPSFITRSLVWVSQRCVPSYTYYHEPMFY